MANRGNFYYSALKQSVARCCQSVGWHGLNVGSCDILTDLLARYIRTIGRSAAAYSNLADRAEPNTLDLLKTFQDLGINERSLLDYVQNVDVGSAPLLPLLPVAHPQNHLFNGPEQKIIRKIKSTKSELSVITIQEEGSAGKDNDKLEEEEEEEEEDDEEWEELPGYLPPLPKIRKNTKGEIEDAESGIHTDDDAIATPTSMKSPSVGGSHPLLKEEDGGSGRSSVSDEIVGGGFAQLPTKFRRQSTVGSPTTPTSVSSLPHTPLEGQSFDLPPPQPSKEMGTIQGHVPTISPVSKPDPTEKVATVKQKSPKPKPKLNLSIPTEEPYEQSESKHLHQQSGSESSEFQSRSESQAASQVHQMPQLHLMSPVTAPIPSVGGHRHQPPSLSPLTKTPPISPMTTKPARPVLRRLSSPSGSSLITNVSNSGKTSSQLLQCKEMELKITRLASLSPQQAQETDKEPSSRSSPVSPQEGSPHDSPIPPQVFPDSVPARAQDPSSPSLSPSPSPFPSPLPSVPSTPSTPLKSPAEEKELSPPSPEAHELEGEAEHTLSVSSLSPSVSSSSSLATNDAVSPPPPQPPPLVQPPFVHDSTSLHSLPVVSVSSPNTPPPPTSHLSLPPPPLLSNVSVYSTSPSGSLSPSTSSTSSSSAAPSPTMPLDMPHPQVSPHHPLMEGNTKVLRYNIPPTSVQTKSPLSNQEEEEEEDSSDSDSSLESPEYPLLKPHEQKPSPYHHPSPLAQEDKGRSVSHLKAPSPDDFTGPLTVSIKKFTSSPRGFIGSVKERSQQMEDNKPPLSTASFGFDVESSKSKNVNSIFLPDVKPCKVDLKSEPETEYSSTSSSMIVRINRNLLKQGAQATRSPGVSAVTVTIQKSILQVKTKGRKTGAEDEANKKGGTGKGRSNRKRELELSEVGLDLKKVRLEPLKEPSKLSKDKSKSQMKATATEGRMTRRTRSQASDDESESDNSGFKLKLKIPKPTPQSDGSALSSSKKKTLLKQGKKPRRPTPTPPLPMAAPAGNYSRTVKSSSPKIHDPSKSKPLPKGSLTSDGLLVTSSTPKKVHSIKVQTAAHTISPLPPVLKTSVSLTGSVAVRTGVTMGTGITSGSGPELYICPMCERPDDGTPMICCDNCDLWLHMRCVGLTQAPPENETWYCTKCAKKKRKRRKQ